MFGCPPSLPQSHVRRGDSSWTEGSSSCGCGNTCINSEWCSRKLHVVAMFYVPMYACIGYILRCRLLRYLHDRGPQARGSCKATYTEVCNLLVPWQQEMQLSQELQDCTCGIL